MPDINTLIFDLGNVVVEWDPRFVFDENYFDSEEKREYFFNHICTSDWNEEQDMGRSIVDATQELVAKFPEWEKPIRDYYGRWSEMLRNPIHGSVEILRKLKEGGKYKLLALTNWNASLFEIALVRHDFLHWFDGRVVSGIEKSRKPFPEFYKILLKRYAVKPEEAIFIDDNQRNINAAAAMGMPVIHYKSPEQLKEALIAAGVDIH